MVFFLNCKKDEITNHNIVKEYVRVTLENQIEHSGIMVKILELDKFFITDSTGLVLFDSIPDGNYILQAKYPYFTMDHANVLFEEGKIQSTVNIELKQQMQFWIEPAETTISMSNLGNPDIFLISGFRQYRVNITNLPVIVKARFDPVDLWAFLPQGFEWPIYPNADSIPDPCYASYGWLGSNDAFHDIYITFQPGDTTYAPVPRVDPILSKCFYINDYLFFSAVTDAYNYPEYFDPIYIRNKSTPDQKLYDKMNRSLLKKLELFRPAIVHITN
jgi:hypothetical protein